MNLEGCSSIEELQRRAREHLENAGNHGHFLEGLGWDQDLLGTTPSRLDVSKKGRQWENVQLIELHTYRRSVHLALFFFAEVQITFKTPLAQKTVYCWGSYPFTKRPNLLPNALCWGGDFV